MVVWVVMGINVLRNCLGHPLSLIQGHIQPPPLMIWVTCKKQTKYFCKPYLVSPQISFFSEKQYPAFSDDFALFSRKNCAGGRNSLQGHRLEKPFHRRRCCGFYLKSLSSPSRQTILITRSPGALWARLLARGPLGFNACLDLSTFGQKRVNFNYSSE